jgi:GlpG protein
MSGVVYGLFGYIWMKGKFDPGDGLMLHSTTIMVMLFWFVFCFFGSLNIANGAHAGGLAVGTLWGYLSSKLLGRR